MSTGKDAGFDLFVFSITDSKTYSWVFMLIAHGKAPFIVGVAAGVIDNPPATFDLFVFSNKKVDYIIPMEKSLGAIIATNLLLKVFKNDMKRVTFDEIDAVECRIKSAFLI